MVLCQCAGDPPTSTSKTPAGQAAPPHISAGALPGAPTHPGHPLASGLLLTPPRVMCAVASILSQSLCGMSKMGGAYYAYKFHAHIFCIYMHIFFMFLHIYVIEVNSWGKCIYLHIFAFFLHIVHIFVHISYFCLCIFSFAYFCIFCIYGYMDICI